MTMPAEEPRPSPSLRVAIVASDPVRRLGLQSIVSRAGHRTVEAAEESDVLLADGDVAVGEGPPLVAVGAAEAGQAGLLPREATAEQIDAALRAAAAGLFVRGAEPPRPAFGALGVEAPALLSPREVEILALIGEGLSNKEVARRLGISGHTVKFHVESLFRKLSAGSRAEAVHKGLRQGLIEL
jgi:DNA-binding NarL/FixJ family response regulator